MEEKQGLAAGEQDRVRRKEALVLRPLPALQHGHVVDAVDVERHRALFLDCCDPMAFDEALAVLSGPGMGDPLQVLAVIDPARLDRVRDRIGPGFVVLGTEQGKPGFKAIVEQSFAMALDDKHASYFWSSKEAQAKGLAGAIVGTHTFAVDGRKGAEEHMAFFVKSHPEITFTIWDVDDPLLPIEIDWAQWWLDSAHSSEKISGVRNKYGARNPRFKVK